MSFMMMAFKGRTFVFAVVLFLFISMMCWYHSSQQSFQNLARSELRCVKEKETISSQLQIVMDHKAHMEKTLSAERADNAKAAAAAEAQLEEDRITLQQLQNQFDDLTAESTKARQAASADRITLEKYKKSHAEIQKSKDHLEIKLEEMTKKYNDVGLELKQLKNQVEILNNKLQILDSKKSILKSQHIGNDALVNSRASVGASSHLVNNYSDGPVTRKENMKPTIPEGVAPELTVNESFFDKRLTPDGNDEKNQLGDDPHNEDFENRLKDKPIEIQDGQNVDNAPDDAFNLGDGKREGGDDFNDVNISLDQAEPAAQNAPEDDDSEGYGRNGDNAQAELNKNI